jgi:hypothetical protein
MARGFDSKSVTDQQEELERKGDRKPPTEVAVSQKRRTLELARIDLVHRLDGAPDGYRVSLRAALDALDDLIRDA